jgi:hypothetical protein
MKSKRFLLAVPFLLGTTALVYGADPAQTVYPVDDAHSFFSLSGTVGGVVMDLPDGGGLFLGEGADDANDLLFGGTVGVSAAVGTGPVLGGLQGFIGLNLFGTYAYADVNKTSAFTGPGVVVVQGGTGPFLSDITIVTSSGATSAFADITSTHTNPDGGGEAVVVASETDPGPGAQDAPYTSNAVVGNSFQWGGGQTRVDGAGGSATAYAALADENGGVFIAAGNLDGLNLTQSYRTEALYLGGDVTFGVAGQNGTTTLQGYVGPSYRYLAQRNSTTSNLFVDVPEYAGVAEFPLLSISGTDTFSSHYMGGIAGLMATIPTSATTALTIGVEGGAYYTMASLSSDGVYTVSGGNLDVGGGVIDPAPAPGAVAPISIEYDGVEYEAETIAFAARGTAAYTVAIAQKAQLTFSGSVDYLSAVAQTGVNATVTGYEGDDDGTVTYQSGGANERISWGHMVNLSGSVSLTGQF